MDISVIVSLFLQMLHLRDLGYEVGIKRVRRVPKEFSHKKTPEGHTGVWNRKEE